MTTTERLSASMLDEREAELAKQAQRCLMTALDHSRAHRIALLDDEGEGRPPELELPPKVLRLFADMLGLMAKRQPFTLMPQGHELTTQEAAAFLNVSRPFVVKELEDGKIPFRRVGRHRRIQFEDLIKYLNESRQKSEDALQELADQAQELGMGY
jgi:excisionase family DNA binding protein